MFNRFFIAAPIAIALSAAFVGAAAGPAIAAPTSVCDTAPAQLRAAAATAQPDAARKALYNVNLGEKLCADNSSFEAKKSFAAASKALGVDLASLPPVTVATAQ